MPAFSPVRQIRSTNSASRDNESIPPYIENVPFLSEGQTFASSPKLEDGGYKDDVASQPDVVKGPVATYVETSPVFDDLTSTPPPRWRTTSIASRLKYLVFRRSKSAHNDFAERDCLHSLFLPSTPLKRVLRLLALALMLLGILEFIALSCGIFFSFFPDEADDKFDGWTPGKMSKEELGHWPTDFSADVHPVACHSHNDYWRKEPLFSALDAGCTGVEADVWLYDEELYVGHSTSSLTPERTFRSLYVNPLVKILDQQNPITEFHPALNKRRNGVYDTKPSQTLVLLVDFKGDGHKVWPYVSQQLEVMRVKKYLSHFNGTKFVEGPITVVVTGNAPWSEVVANSYRDMFFDAPLDLMGNVPESEPSLDTQDDTLEKRASNQGQGRSGAAPSDPTEYSLANSYYASVSFSKTIGYPWRGVLSQAQIEIMRKQIAGAHAQGLKVRYWSVPNWPRGMRNYLWRTLVKEGVDFLNVDDLLSATKGDWNWDKKQSWFSGPWSFWTSKTSH